jgi:SAM-dependent methyltransferase
VTIGQRFARLTTDLVVRWPFAWRLLRAPLRRMFDRLAPVWATARSPGHYDALGLAFDAIPEPPHKVLDLGSGTGAATVVIAERWPEAEVVGVDVSSGMVGEARRRLPSELQGRVRYEVGDAEALPFPDGSFDLVLLANMIPFFDELVRLVTPGGHIVFFASLGAQTPMYVPPERLRQGLRRRGFSEFAEFTAGTATSLLARKPHRS